mgnify:CR=1 FL=1
MRQSYAWQKTTNKTTSATVDLSGKFNTGIFEHQLLVGADWSHEDRDPKLGNYSSGSVSYYGYINPYDISDYYDGLPANASKVTTTVNHHDADNVGIFIQDLISLTPTLKMMLGLRYDAYEFKSHATVSNRLPVDLRRTFKDETFSPNVGFVWQLVPEHSLYASYSKSFAPYGGRGNISLDTNVDESLYDAEPQYNEQYEVGVKSDWFDGRLNTQFSVFDITKNNIRYQPDSVNQPLLWSVGQQQESKGIEFSFIGKLLDNLYARGGYGYTNAEWTKDSRTNVATASRIKEGNRLTNVSENTGNLFLRYLATEKVYGEIGATYVGSFYTDNANTAKVDGWTRMDAAIGYKDDKWGATFAINNVTDKEYWRSSSMPGAPRNYLFRLNYFF